MYEQLIRSTLEFGIEPEIEGRQAAGEVPEDFALYRARRAKSS